MWLPLLSSISEALKLLYGYTRARVYTGGSSFLHIHHIYVIKVWEMLEMRRQKGFCSGMFCRFPSYGRSPVLGNHGNGRRPSFFPRK